MEPPDVQGNKDSLKNSLNHLRQESDLTDITLVCKDRIIPAHKLILCAENSYFHAIFTSNSPDVDKERIELPQLSGEAMEITLEFLYTGRIPPIQDIQNEQNLLRELTYVADFLQEDNLFCYYFNLIAENLSRTNLEELVHLGLGYENKRELCFCIICSNLANKFCHLNERDDFLVLTGNEIKEVLHHCQLAKMNMDDAMRMILSWVSFKKKREDDLIDLLQFLDLKHVSLHLLKRVLKENDVIKRNRAVWDLLSAEMASRQTNRDISEKSSKNDSAWLLCFSNEYGKADVRAYDVNADKWLPRKALPFFLLDRTATVQYQRHIYFLGGCTNETRKKMLNPFKTLGSTLIYNYCPVANTVTNTDNLLFPVCSASAGVLNGWIYIVGGWDRITDALSGRRVQRYNPLSGNCEELSPTIGEYISPQVLSYNNRLYIASEISGIVECYDAHHDHWTTLTQLACIKDDTNSTVVFSDMKLFVLVEKGQEQQFHVYDIVSNQWSVRKFHHGPKEVAKMWSVKQEEKSFILTEMSHRTLYLYDVESSQWQKKHHIRDSFSDYWTTVGIPAPQLIEVKRTFSHNLLPSLNFFMKQSTMTDIVLVCGGKTFQAHRLVLSASSPYFYSMLTVNWEEGKNGIIHMPTVSAETMEIILAFIYTGSMQDNAMQCRQQVEVLAAAHLMQLFGLSQQCFDSLAKQLSMQCLQEVNDLAELYDHQVLSSCVVAFMVRNILEFMSLHEFLEINVYHLKRILQHPNLNLTHLEHIINGIIIWVEFEPHSRSCQLHELLELVNLDALPTECLSRISELKTVKYNTCAIALLNLTVAKQSKKVKKHLFSSQSRKDSMLRLSFRNRSCKPNGQKLLCFGKGEERSVLRVYDVECNKWLPIKDIPFSISTNMAVVPYGRYVYFLGGEIDEVATSLAYKYCPSTNKIVDSTCLMCAVTQAAAGVLNDFIYIVGGKNSESQWSNTVQQFMPMEGTCQTVRSTIRKPPKRVEVLPHNNLLYVLGSKVVDGIDTENSTTLLECYVESYNPVYDQWTMVTHSPTAFTCLQLSAIFCGKLYVVSDTWECQLLIDLYDISSDKWSSTSIKNKLLQTVTGLWTAYKKDMPILLVADINNKLNSYNIITQRWEYSLNSNKTPWNESLSVVMTSPFL